MLSYCLHTVISPIVGDILPRGGRAVADDYVVEGARVAVVSYCGAGGAAQLELVRHRAVLDRAVTLNARQAFFSGNIPSNSQTHHL